jgi:3,4-dihydroxy-2-butanone 4-phosphate synthase
MSVFATIAEAIEDIRQGKIILVVDDEDRENEGDLLMAAEKATPEAVNFMAKHGRGLICVPMTGERLDELEIGMMVANNTAPMGTAFTVTVDARRGVTTGTSAYDRAVTIRTLVDPTMGSRDLTAPGHIFPLRAMPGGVLRRAGHTEAAVDLARLADCYPAGVICEVLDEDGSMARMPQLLEVAKTFKLKMITIKALIEHRVVFLAVRRSRFGRMLAAMRDAPNAAQTLGMNITAAKLKVFGLSALMAGAAGALLGGLQSRVGQLDFLWFRSLSVLLIATVFGITSVSGAFLGALFFVVLPDLIRSVGGDSDATASLALQPLIIGLLAIATARRPEGLAGQIRSRLRPLLHRLPERMWAPAPENGEAKADTAVLEEVRVA